MFYAAGIPTYTVVAELALNQVLVGDLPRPEYPEALAEAAESRWRRDALLSIGYAQNALLGRADPAVAIANGCRSLIELAHSRAASERRWVLNEKGLLAASGLARLGQALAFAPDESTLSATLSAVERAAKGSGV